MVHILVHLVKPNEKPTGGHVSKPNCTRGPQVLLLGYPFAGVPVWGYPSIDSQPGQI